MAPESSSESMTRPMNILWHRGARYSRIGQVNETCLFSQITSRQSYIIHLTSAPSMSPFSCLNLFHENQQHEIGNVQLD